MERMIEITEMDMKADAILEAEDAKINASLYHLLDIYCKYTNEYYALEDTDPQEKEDLLLEVRNKLATRITKHMMQECGYRKNRANERIKYERI